MENLNGFDNEEASRQRRLMIDRALFSIKKYYNGLEIMQKLPHRFNTWKEGIEKIPGVQSIERQNFGENNSLYVITLTGGQQFGLPKQAYSSSIEFAFEEIGDAGYRPLKKVLKLAKIEDGKIIKKGEVEYDDSMNESLMLRWKTLAGIKRTRIK
jgi:hypothetical protein